ncbi:tRNA (adenine(58)-N(1))-methyltransferase catalytic subunit trm61 [Escovopsis weberi]|uniref:tRNA (adenine(58)-N(1))-methyltransferase catalytic subunit TRM61 n=1 Tax=Escovopsis weberi TaxID=150374 RepID=A0A0M9VS00_ESCWE|nr:tRNA (adenine(58)-N(1))-methyltransferase catalytic subunit trm61 [Escovopsis weberi]
MARPSPFLEPGSGTSQDALAIISLSRDAFQPLTLEKSTGAVNGYAEGATLNTRFGSFPHSTLLDIPWGSQVRASTVDTGSRGRKRRRDATDEDTPVPSPPRRDGQQSAGNPNPNAPVKKAVAASSGFIYVLRPTPELWTMSLPHRTQVVYTPDYSYVLHRIRARPGTRIIEAGAGSGSFTHASVRAVYNGYAEGAADDARGKVFSFEYNEARFHKMQVEVRDHGLEGLVRLTHRDVYKDGFLLDGRSPRATAVFLDLPAPWEALHHLSRRKIKRGGEPAEGDPDWESPLDPRQSVHICTFSPCIEQVTRTVTELRTLGWVDVDMVAISHKRINVVRDRIGLSYPSGEKGFNPSAVDVAEAMTRLRGLAERTRELQREQQGSADVDVDMDADSTPSAPTRALNTRTRNSEAGEDGNAVIGDDDNDKQPWLQGRLVHRPEGELKTHTSYLVFAVLPCEWDEEAEAAAQAKWPCGNEKKTIGNLDKKTRKEEKRKMMEGKSKKLKKGGEGQITVPKMDEAAASTI